MRTFGCGHDHGNSRTSVITYINGQEHLRTFPSVSADGSLKELARIRRADGQGTDYTVDFQCLTRGEYVFTSEGVDRFIGELAVTQGEVPSTGRNATSRYWSRRSLETLLVAAADMIPDATFELLVVTGLPVATFNEETRKKVKDALNGMHHFTLNGYERTAFVKVGKVLMEGAGASLLHDVEDNEDIYGFIDIGGKTTDLYVRQGLQPIAKKCRGIDIGVEHAVDAISTWFEDLYGYALSHSLRTRIMRAYTGQGHYPTIHTDSGPVPQSDLVRWTRKAFAETGARLTEEIAKVWHTGDTGKVAADFSQVDIVGGGAYYFLPHIQSLIPRAVALPEPEHANARGYGWFAHELVKQRMVKSVAS